MQGHRITLIDITVDYNGEIILKDLNAEFKGPGLVQVLGPNGAGKSTLFRTILGLVKPAKGTILIDGEDVTGNPLKAGRKIGYVPQIVLTEIEEYPLSTWEYILMSRQLHKRWPRITSENDKREIARILQLVGLEREAWKKPIRELSGGQRQRALIARALIHNPPILLMDEPLSSIDPKGKKELADLIGRLSIHRLVIVATHDPTILLPYTKTVLLLNRHFYRIGKPEEVLEIENLKAVYGEAVIHLENHIHICDSHFFKRK